MDVLGLAVKDIASVFILIVENTAANKAVRRNTEQKRLRASARAHALFHQVIYVAVLDGGELVNNDHLSIEAVEAVCVGGERFDEPEVHCTK